MMTNKKQKIKSQNNKFAYNLKSGPSSEMDNKSILKNKRRPLTA